VTNDFSILDGAPEVVAPRLLGSLLVRELPDGQRVIGRIVETEAYHQSDAASHSYKGSTPRTEVMFGPSGFCYVYFTYGMHYCMNVVTGPVGEGSAVLIRALEPVSGVPDGKRTDGPARLCYALQVDKTFNGHDLRNLPLQLQILPSVEPSEIVQTTRVGISKDIDRPWRFYIRKSLFISKR
jgi:DNA-3-methyladenine glycosylase